MLLIKAEIIFFKVNYTDYWYSDYLMPAFRFGEYLFTGKVEKSIYTRYEFDETYSLDVTLPFVVDEIYEHVTDFIFIGSLIDIQDGSKVIGKAKILDYIYG